MDIYICCMFYFVFVVLKFVGVWYKLIGWELLRYECRLIVLIFCINVEIIVLIKWSYFILINIIIIVYYSDGFFFFSWIYIGVIVFVLIYLNCFVYVYLEYWCIIRNKCLCFYL